MARITVEEISRKEFSFANKGYNQKEVDDFLDDICDEIERMENEIMDLRQKTTVVRNETPNSTVSAENEQSFREVNLRKQEKEAAAKLFCGGLSSMRYEILCFVGYPWLLQHFSGDAEESGRGLSREV